MRRDLSLLTNQIFDLLIVGGGIHGACIAWDATLRGLSVAIVDRGDFGAATSANSLRIVHGGLRYLARGDVPRMLESMRERSALLRIAPGLVEPLPVLAPIYGQTLLRGRHALRLALAANDAVSRGRNRGLEPSRQLPRSRVLSRAETLDLFPWFSREQLTGGALWFDARMVHPERLTLSFVCSATRRGAVAANYVAVDRLLLRNGVVEGAAVTDRLRGEALEVRSRCVVVAAGPWTGDFIASTVGGYQAGPGGRALALNVVTQRRLGGVAVGVQARTGATEDPVCGGHRFLFTTPQIGGTLLGTWYAGLSGDDDIASECERGVRHLVGEFNESCPGLDLTPAQVVGYQWGWVPLLAGALAERPRIIDHGQQGVRHLLSVEGVKYTTARAVAERAVDWVFRDREQSSPRCRTSAVPLDMPGGGTVTPGETIERTDILRAIHDEMAVKLGDIVRRCTSRVNPLSRAALVELAGTAAPVLGWTSTQQASEVEEVVRQGSPTSVVMERVG